MAGVARSTATGESQATTSDEGIAQEPIKAEGLAVGLVDFSKPGFDLHLGRSHVEDLDRLFDDIEIGQRGPNKEDARAVVEEQRLLVLLPGSDARGINTAHAGTTHATHTAAHAAHSTHTHATAHAAHATAHATHAAAATSATGHTGNHGHREIQTTGHEELTHNDLDVGREVGASDSGDSRTTHAATTTAHAATAAAAASHAASHAAATADFNARDGENATLTLLAAATATAAATALATTTLGGDRGANACDAFQTFHEGIGIDTPPAGVQLTGLRKTLPEHDAPLLDGILERLLGDFGDDFQNVGQPQVPQGRIDAHRNVVEVERLSSLLCLLRSSGNRIDAASRR